MITEFKIFEAVLTKKKYWVIPLDDYFYIRLIIKLGLSIDQAEEIYNFYLDLHDNQQFSNNEQIYIFVAFDENDELSEWSTYEAFENEKNIHSEDFEVQGFIKQPDIEITQKDIDNWQMLMDTNKYNI
jgi:hypothetical protein